MRRHELTDSEWQRIEPLLPPQKPETGHPNKDHRQVLNGIFWVQRTGAPWRDARISVSSGRALVGAHASTPSGAMITFCPPRRFHLIGTKTVRVSIENPVVAAAFVRDFMPPSGTLRGGVFPTPGPELCLPWHTPVPHRLLGTRCSALSTR
jgi:hypothetical protein